MHKKNTKITCTLGPSSDSITELEKLVSAGMDLARLNFSHGTHENHKKIIKNLREVEKRTGKRIGIIQDLQGPKIRIGEMPDEGIAIKKGETITITTENIKGYRNKKSCVIPIQYKGITKDCKKGDYLLIDDGLMEIKILSRTKTELKCKVQVGGVVKNHKGVNAPTASISASAITQKDKEDLIFGLKQDVDFIALSFVKSKKDIQTLRKLIEAKGKSTKIISKVERHEAVKNIKEIVLESDAVMVARGDLGVEIPAEQVPIVQKRLIHLANKYGKPVILATQVLQSMVENSRATRAEISDAANAVFDHTDSIMLSNESAVGRYPFRAARTLSKVAETVEKSQQKHEELTEYLSKNNLSSTDATCLSACELAVETKPKYLVVYTQSGYTARHVAKHRIYTPIITITENDKTARELTIVWGINETIVEKGIEKSKDKQDKIISVLKNRKIVRKGDNIVLVGSASEKGKIISSIKI